MLHSIYSFSTLLSYYYVLVGNQMVKGPVRWPGTAGGTLTDQISGFKYVLYYLRGGGTSPPSLCSSSIRLANM